MSDQTVISPPPTIAAEYRCFACERAVHRVLRGVRDVHAGTGRTYDLIWCEACGATKMARSLTAAEVAQIYPDEYYSYQPPQGLKAKLVRFKRRVIDRPFIPHFQRLLEVGCDYGELLGVLAQRGEAVGLERSKTPAEFGRRSGLNIISGDVEDTGLFAPGSFDYIYSNHSFEHLTDPNAALRSFAQWLAPGGKLFIAVPNFAGAVPRWFGKNWYYIGPPLHVTNSTPASMRAMLQRHGFEVERIGYKSFPVSIAASLVMTIFGSRMDSMPASQRLLVTALSIAAMPLSLCLDAIGAGDCMEVHARKAA